MLKEKILIQEFTKFVQQQAVCWKPYWVTCRICSMDYQLVLKLETMQEDEHFLITLAGLTELKQVSGLLGRAGLAWRGML